MKPWPGFPVQPSWCFHRVGGSVQANQHPVVDLVAWGRYRMSLGLSPCRADDTVAQVPPVNAWVIGAPSTEAEPWQDPRTAKIRTSAGIKCDLSSPVMSVVTRCNGSPARRRAGFGDDGPGTRFNGQQGTLATDSPLVELPPHCRAVQVHREGGVTDLHCFAEWWRCAAECRRR